MSLRIIKRDPSGEDKEVILQIDPTQNGQPVEQTFSVTGKALNATGTGQAGVTIRIYDRGLNIDTLLGEGVTNSEGVYLIYYSSTTIPDGKLRADLVVMAFDVTPDPDLKLAESPVLVSALTKETVDITIVAPEEFVGISEYQEVKEKVEPLLAGVTIDSIKRQGIEVMASKVELESIYIADFLKARQLNSQYSSISEEVFYGLVRYDLPYNASELIQTTDLLKREALEATTSSNIINPAIAATIDDVLLAFGQLLVQDALQEDGGGETVTSQLLSVTGLSTQKKEGFYAAYLEDSEDAGFWDKIVTDNVLTAAERDNVRFVLQLGVIAQNHVPMVDVLYNDGTLNNPDDLGLLTNTQWLAFIDSPGVGVPNIDPGDITAQDKQGYIDAMVDTLEKAFPSRVLTKDFQADPDYAGRPILQFGQDNPDYDIKDNSPRKYLDDNPTALNGQADPDAAKADLYQTRRLWHIAKGKEKTPTIKALETNNLTSANRIATVGKRNFVTQYAPELGGEEQAKQIYQKAVKRSAAAVMLKAAFSPQINDVPTNVFSDAPISEDDIQTNPELEVLFGDQDYCNCTACRSSFSPAAYLIDLLSFLREAQTGGPSSAWDIIKQRRPEFENIDLSCENTNTVLPYIDLVNEVLENAISTTKNNDRQTTREPNVLRAEPEHINKEAYDTVIAQKYPWGLPFNLWNEEGVTYAGQLEVKRADITKALARRAFETTQMTLEEACIYLGISTFMYNDVLRDTTFMPHYDNKTTATLNRLVDEDPVMRNGLLEVAAMSFEELNELLTMQFLNADGSRNVTFAPLTSCKLEDAELNFVAADYQLLHKFIRLSNLLGWSYKTLDLAIAALGFTSVVDALIIALAELKQLEDRFNKPVEELVSWIAPLSLHNYGDDPSEFDRIFLNPIYFTLDNTAAPGTTIQEKIAGADSTSLQLLNAEGDDLEQEIAPILVAALRLSSKEITRIVNAELPAPATDKNGLSHLYRVASFVRTSRLSVSDYLELQAIMGSSPIAKPMGSSPAQVLTNALKWFNDLDTVTGRGFKVNQLNFLLRDVLDSQFQQTSDSNISAELNNLRSAVRRKLSERSILLNVDYTSLTSTEFQQAADDLLAVFLLFMDENDAAAAVAISQDITNTISDRDAFLDRTWGPVLGDLNTVKTQLDALSDLAQRYEYIMRLWYPQLISLLDLGTEVTQLLSINSGTDQAIIENLVTERLEQQSSPGNPLLNIYVSFDFVSSSGVFTNAAPWLDHYIGLKQLLKLIETINQLGITSDQLEFVLDETSNTDWYPLKSLPLTAVAAVSPMVFASFVRLLRAYELESKYAVSGTYSIIGLLEKINDGIYNQQDAIQELADMTAWNLADINFLVSPSAFNLSAYPDNFNTESWIADVEQVINLSSKFKVSAVQIDRWKGQDLTFEQAQQIKQAVKASYDIDSWYKIAGDLRDKLRGKQRDALVAFILANNSHYFLTADDIYQYYLIDVQTAPCSITSRIKLAISSIQLWVQRIRMNLEPEFSFSDEDLDEWKWRKNYRVWEAARKVFLYPENWIEPELRDDKSQFFQEMEEELLQDEVTEETAERAYLNYLYKLDEVALLEMSGTYLDEERNILYVYARTKNSPHTYYTRQMVDGFRWTSWERVDLDIEGDHLIPVVFNRRPMLFWPVFNEKPTKIEENDLDVLNSTGDGVDRDKDTKLSKQPVTKVEIQMAFSEFKNNRWQAKKISKTGLLSNEGVIVEKYSFKIEFDEDGLNIQVFYRPTETDIYRSTGVFKLNNCTAEIEVSPDSKAAPPSDYSVSNSFRSYMKILEFNENDKFEITEQIRFSDDVAQLVATEFKTDTKTILNNTPNRFKITYPVTGAELLSETPFFYEDNQRVFFVKPSDETFSNDILINLEPKILTIRKPIPKPVPIIRVPDPPVRYIPRAIPPRIQPINLGGGNLGFDRELGQLSRQEFFLL